MSRYPWLDKSEGFKIFCRNEALRIFGELKSDCTQPERIQITSDLKELVKTGVS